MDKTTVSQTKTAINALLDVYQYWIDYAPEYNLSEKDILKLQKKLKTAQTNIEKMYQASEEKLKNL
jgi:hypothetical protein